MADGYASSEGQILYLPSKREERDLLLATDVLFHSKFRVLWVAWTHAEGRVMATGPFPYDVTLIRPGDDADGEN